MEGQQAKVSGACPGPSAAGAAGGLPQVRPAEWLSGRSRARVGPLVDYDVLLRWVLYALVPVLTLAVEDRFLIEVLGYSPWGGQFGLRRAGLTAGDVAGVLLAALTAPLWFRRRTRGYLKVFLLFGAAVLVSGVYGLIRGASPDYALFEPSVWKTLVGLFGLTLAFSHLFARPGERDRFLAWFCWVQVGFAVFALGAYLFLGRGQETYFEAVVPVFAGDMLIFLVTAYALSFFRMAAAHRWRDGIAVGVLATVILASLRRSFSAAVFSAPLFLAGVVLWRRERGAAAWRVLGAVLVVALALWVFVGYVGPWRLPGDLVTGRLRSINLFWAERQGESIYGSVGHTADFLDGLETVLKSPLLGQGLAVWFELPRTSRWQEANVHAGIFKVWIKLGLLGVVAYLLLFGRGLRWFRTLRRRGPDEAARLFVVWFALHFILVSVYMNSILFGYKNSFVTAMYLGLCASLGRGGREEEG